MDKIVQKFGEWMVSFDGGFLGSRENGHDGTEIQLDQSFDWAGHHWIVPAAYSCAEGLVVDFCMQTPAEDIRRFIEKWDLSPENDSCENFTPEQQTLSQKTADSDRWRRPTHFIAMSYTLSPEPENPISVFDCAESDKPLELAPDTGAFETDLKAAATVRIIGGADGPIAIFLLENDSQENAHIACSARHFEPVTEEIEWRMEFQIDRFEKKRVRLMQQRTVGKDRNV